MIPLGSKVRDLITGLAGVATGRSEYLYGCVHVCVESTDLKSEGKPSGSVWIDEQRVELVEEGVFPCVAPDPALHIRLGATVRDRISGFAGLVIGRVTWPSGNVELTVEPTALHDGKRVKSEMFEAARLEVLAQTPAPVSRHSSATSGGPRDDPPPPAPR